MAPDSPRATPSGTAGSWSIQATDAGLCLTICGDWTAQCGPPAFEELRTGLEVQLAGVSKLVVDTVNLTGWDSLLPARLLQCVYWCNERHIDVDLSNLPDAVGELLRIATAVEPHRREAIVPLAPMDHWRAKVRGIRQSVLDFSHFIGALAMAIGAMLVGRSNTRLRDVLHFIEQAGPRALGIVTLISVLVGMILAYMGTLQLRQFGAQIYVANLVGIGMVREMAALMTAIIMAGRTGAAYAAQLGTMQTNEEIDAIETLGMSPMEFLVVPRMLALTLIMPLLVTYSIFLGILGGAFVAIGLDVSLLQYMNQIQATISWADIGSGLIKSVVYGVLIAVAGCQAGLQCGRSSAAVGEATTSAVVKAIVYIIVADSLLNIVYDKVGF